MVRWTLALFFESRMTIIVAIDLRKFNSVFGGLEWEILEGNVVTKPTPTLFHSNGLVIGGCDLTPFDALGRLWPFLWFSVIRCK